MFSNRSRNLTLAVASALATLMILAGVGEVAVRLNERHRRTAPGTLPLLFYRSVLYGHALVRGADYFGWVRVGRQGFRGGEVSLTKTPGSTRVMIVGSSTTFDSFVTGGDSAAWPARLEHYLNQAGRLGRFEVINAGVPGYTAADDLIRLETDLYRYRPDVILLYEGHNDLYRALQSGGQPSPWSATPGEMPVVTPWGRWLERHSLLYTKLVGRYQAWRFSRSRPRSNGSSNGVIAGAAIDSGALAFEHFVAAFATQTRALGVRLVIPELLQVSGASADSEPDPIARAAWQASVPFSPVPAVLAGYRRFNDVLRDVAQRSGATWISTQSFALVGRQWYSPGDPIHFNDAGADRMARAMAHALLTLRPGLASAPNPAQP